jgi:hypothetical protein
MPDFKITIPILGKVISYIYDFYTFKHKRYNVFLKCEDWEAFENDKDSYMININIYNQTYKDIMIRSITLFDCTNGEIHKYSKNFLFHDAKFKDEYKNISFKKHKNTIKFKLHESNQSKQEFVKQQLLLEPLIPVLEKQRMYKIITKNNSTKTYFHGIMDKLVIQSKQFTLCIKTTKRPRIQIEFCHIEQNWLSKIFHNKKNSKTFTLPLCHLQ